MKRNVVAHLLVVHILFVKRDVMSLIVICFDFFVTFNIVWTDHIMN